MQYPVGDKEHEVHEGMQHKNGPEVVEDVLNGLPQVSNKQWALPAIQREV